VVTEAIFEKQVQTVVGMVHAQTIRTEKVAFLGKYPVLMNYSEDHKIGPAIHREYRLYNQRGRKRISYKFFLLEFREILLELNFK